MTNTIYKESKEQKKLSFFDYAIEVVGWLQIVASPLISGIIVGGLAYLLIGNTGGIVVGTIIAIVALVLGVLYANRVWKKKGTMNFMSSVNASPELDYLEQGVDQDKRHTTEASQNGS
ncbi:hypothetical protein EXU57_24795 [Segetibacter sp. 3557_3]|uniref:hypothetical protein n=1 Tax=Segetibacter sp. 3557_3 TaxID=2547429 RepID=UPI001058788C|nr:hypothetical protein [Segetibacter sp. 3557_3]TDH17810.1 hypothetical protein EXU57_24795 [Segetibacter sp. 3557_3]